MTRSSRLVNSLAAWFLRRTGPLGVVCLVLILVTGPWLLFFDPIGWPGQAHIARDPSAFYWLHSDDFAYVAASRTPPRTLANLFAPHNAHIVPAWRVLTWALVAWSGSLVKLPAVLAQAAYGILVAVMLMTARLVARETGRAGLGLAAMADVGTTSVMATPARLLTAMALGGGKIDSTVSFHGRTPGEAARPVEGLLHTAQAIPENLILGNLGLKAQTTPVQGVT